MPTPDQALAAAQARAEARRLYELQTLADGKDSFVQLSGRSVADAKPILGLGFDVDFHSLVIDASAAISMATGQSIDIHAYLRYRDDRLQRIPRDADVTWISSNGSVATVEFGKITAVGAGTCEIYATESGFESNHIGVTVS